MLLTDNHPYCLNNHGVTVSHKLDLIGPKWDQFHIFKISFQRAKCTENNSLKLQDLSHLGQI